MIDAPALLPCPGWYSRARARAHTPHETTSVVLSSPFFHGQPELTAVVGGRLFIDSASNRAVVTGFVTHERDITPCCSGTSRMQVAPHNTMDY